MRLTPIGLCLLHTISPVVWAEQPYEDQPPSLQLESMIISSFVDDVERADGPVKGYRATRSASATRTDTALHETPQSVSVVPRAVFEDSGATRLQDGLDYAGGVGRANNFGGQGLTGFTIRGFNSGEFYRNGFPINRGYPNAPDAYNIERLEVLRGPAATLYGRSDPGGTFNVVSKQPQAEPQVSVGSQLNDQGMQRGTLDATGALDEEGKLTYRLNLLGEGGESFREHVESERYGVTPVLSWQLNDATRVTLEAEVLRNNHPLDRGLPHFPGQVGTPSRETNLWGKGSDNLLHNDNEMLQLRFEHWLNNDWTLAGGVQYLEGTLQGNAIEGNALQADGRTLGRNFNGRRLAWDDLDVQLNLTGRFDALGLEHTLLTGVEYEDYHYDLIIRRSAGGADAYAVDIFDPQLDQPRPALTRTPADDSETLESKAVFLQDQVDLSARLKALVGVRFEHYAQDFHNHLPGRTGWSTEDHATTPRAGLIYQLTDSLNLYANASRSYKPNHGASRQGGGFAPEQGKAYELGVKWQSLDQRLSVDAALYHIVKQNVLTVDPLDSTFKVATGEARSRGFDLNIAGNLTPEWKVIGGYAYVDAEVTKDSTVPDGTRLANVPRNSLSLLNLYEFQDGAAKGLGLGLGVKYVDERAGKTLPDAFEMQGYTVVDLLSHYQLSPQIRLNLDVKNLFDEEYEEGAFLNYAYPGAPRTAQLGIAYTF
ncbi:TonB-dependent siderophore receptor [Pseudomonas benzenivorans]|uniref:TonB-dependent siderophore receptor n=1 Tax=Pseudomonas benzenivorans TaxID=556533 RepID=A0ABZ0PZ82_9PSED|nr:TonB-dependent siderophore receptor [Pseudomonas benzenivorans]WPC06175.1 TonB-dependent siderophore receptor [Pseudomonas benzenivorans]